MWIYFSQNGTLLKKVLNGSQARVGVLSEPFSIHVYFQDLDINNKTATLSIRRPNGSLLTPIRAMTGPQSETFTALSSDGDVTPFVSGTAYNTFKWDTDNISDFDAPGTYQATVRLYDSFGNVFVAGRLDFYVEDAVIDDQDHVLSPTEYSQLMAQLGNKANAHYVIRRVDDITASTFDINTYAADDVIFDNAQKQFWKVVAPVAPSTTKTKTRLDFFVDLTSDQTIGGHKTFTNGVLIGQYGDASVTSNSDGDLILTGQSANPLIVTDGALYPEDDGGADLGATTERFRDLFLSGNVKDANGNVKYGLANAVEYVANKDIEIPSGIVAPTAGHYPTTSAVKTYTDNLVNNVVERMELLTNKATNFATVNNTKYPSVKAVSDFVNSSIAQQASYFRGNFNTKAALLAVDWQTTDPTVPHYVTNNDYAVVNADETHSNESWRYKYTTGSGWNAEYKINNAPFTQAQLQAINSGITSAKVAIYDANILPTKVADRYLHVNAEGTALEWAVVQGGGGGASNLENGSGNHSLQQKAQENTNFKFKNPNYTVPQELLTEINGTLDSEGYVNGTQGAYGEESFEQNGTSVAHGKRSISQGWSNIAYGVQSHAEGNNTAAIGEGSHTEGARTTATGLYSHAEGGETLASGNYSHALGNNTQATANYATAIGSWSKARGQASFVGGTDCDTTGMNGFAFGKSLIGIYNDQAIFGQYNAGSQNALFIVGNGSNNSNRSNAFEVYADGTAKLGGNKTVATTDLILITAEDYPIQ